MKTRHRLMAGVRSWRPEEPKVWIVYGLILAAIPGVVAASWIGFPLSKGWSGLSFSLVAYVRATHRVHLVSFGLLEALALLVGAEAYRRKRWQLTYWAGAALLLTIMAGTLHLIFGEPAFIKDLLTQVTWQQAAVQFAQSYLPPAPVSEPAVSYSLFFDNVGERLGAGWYFMGLGWYVGLALALALMICGSAGLAQRAVRRARRTTALLVLAVLTVFLFRPLLGEHDLVRAARAETQWHPDEAEKFDVRAMREDRWNALDLGLHERIGALDQARGRTDTPEYHLYRAELMVTDQKLPEAIAQYEGIAAAAGPLSALARDRANQLWVTYGLNLFDAGAYGSAVVTWQHALDNQPGMWIVAFYLTRAYFAVGRYDDAMALAQRSIEQTSDPQFLANLYSNCGDAQLRNGEFGNAHASYAKSYFYNYVPNWRAITSLTGSVDN